MGRAQETARRNQSDRKEDPLCLYPEMMMCLLGSQGKRLSLDIARPGVFCSWRGRGTAQYGKTKVALAWEDGQMPRSLHTLGRGLLRSKDPVGSHDG